MKQTLAIPRRYLVSNVETIVDLIREEVISYIEEPSDRRRGLVAIAILKGLKEHYEDHLSFSIRQYLCQKTMEQSLGEVILLLLKERGGEAARRELVAEIKELFPRFYGKSVSDVSRLLGNTLDSLRYRGLVANVRRGVWALTPKGEREAEKLDWERVIETISPGLLEVSC